MIVAERGGVDPAWKREQLADIGVPEDVLTTAVLTGDDAAARCTPNHPPMASGFYRFSETMRSLGEQLAPFGWTRRDYKNFSTVVRPDGRVAIAVASGDTGTGDLTSEVTTRSPKGVVTQEVVETNLSLPLDDRYERDNERIMSGPERPKTATWFLLHDRRNGILYAELSFPQAIDGEGYVRTWDPRIPIGPQASPELPLDLQTEPPLNPTVDVKRRDDV